MQWQLSTAWKDLTLICQPLARPFNAAVRGSEPWRPSAIWVHVACRQSAVLAVPAGDMLAAVLCCCPLGVSPLNLQSVRCMDAGN